MMLLALAETIVTLTAEGNLSSGELGQPVSIAPDIAHDVTLALRLALVHSRYATTNMRTSAGGGVCVYGNVNCEGIYDNVGLESHYTLSPQLVVMGGLHWLDIDDDDFGVKLAARFQRAFGAVTLYTTPTAIIPERAWLPLGADVRVIGGLVVGLASGVTAPFDALGDFEIPVVGSLAYTHRPITAGISFAWTKLWSGIDQPASRAPVDGLDYRVVQIWVGATW